MVGSTVDGLEQGSLHGTHFGENQTGSKYLLVIFEGFPRSSPCKQMFFFVDEVWVGVIFHDTCRNLNRFGVGSLYPDAPNGWRSYLH